MASKLVPVATRVVNNGRNLIYTCPVSKTAVVFSGTLANISSTYGQVAATLEIETSGVFVTVGKDIFIPYGLSIVIPKIVMGAGSKLHATISVANTVDCVLAIVEKDA